eukprot:scaffold19037_cov63-Phaeocystis_antarctica.AAC.2
MVTGSDLVPARRGVGSSALGRSPGASFEELQSPPPPEALAPALRRGGLRRGAAAAAVARGDGAGIALPRSRRGGRRDDGAIGLDVGGVAVGGLAEAPRLEEPRVSLGVLRVVPGGHHFDKEPRDVPAVASALVGARQHPLVAVASQLDVDASQRIEARGDDQVGDLGVLLRRTSPD